jgi:hypothetical protein
MLDGPRAGSVTLSFGEFEDVCSYHGKLATYIYQ